VNGALDVAACYSSLAREPLSAETAARLAGVMKALADPVRLRLLSLIQAHEGGEACVCDLTEPISLSQPTISHHLKVLLDAGLVEREKRGVWAYYRTVPDALSALGELIGSPARA
jgi:ArsR family transcriptional regulator, arsenate/arsenite/antimonite-responsive transcriptional repressor